MSEPKYRCNGIDYIADPGYNYETSTIYTGDIVYSTHFSAHDEMYEVLKCGNCNFDNRDKCHKLKLISEHVVDEYYGTYCLEDGNCYCFAKINFIRLIPLYNNVIDF